jgi:UPF0755 protein
MLRKFLQPSLLAFLVLDLTAIVFALYLTIGSRGAADADSQTVIGFRIESGQGAKEIASNLEEAGIISNDLFFNYYLWGNKSASRLQAGEYELSPSMTIPEIVRTLAEGKVKFDPGIKITIPEGYTVRQIEDAIIAGGLNIKKSELQEAVGITAPLAKEIFGFAFLADLPSRATLDGFLFPDTYFFDENSTLNDIVKKMLGNFDSKISDAMRVKIKARGKNLYEVVIMASLLEREVQTYEDMRVVSGVLWKRMEIGMPLQVDATIAYLAGKKTGEISNEDKLIDSPYNTYKYRGLPPSPIANPGSNAINAAIDPEESEYLYYLSTPTGETIFSKTLDEHNENRAKYLR